MIELFDLFYKNLLPVFLAAGAGYLVARRFQLNPRTLSQVIFYIFAPCLIFNLITKSQVGNGDILLIALVFGTCVATVGVITWSAGRLLRLERRTLAAVILASIFMNAGNFGLPVVMFAFGEEALAFASIFFLFNVMLTYTAGSIIASLGSTSFLKSLAGLFRLPVVYAMILAILFLSTGWKLPAPLERTITLLGDASIPGLLVLLGMQLHFVGWSGRILPLALVNVMRLIVSPAIMLLLSAVFHLHGAVRQAVVIEAAMPTAVLTTVLATEYDCEPAFVTASVFTTTILSVFILTPLLAYLGA